MNNMKCKRCGYEWTPRGTSPLCCPRCKSYFYDVEIKTNTRVLKVEKEEQEKSEAPSFPNGDSQ